MPELKHSFQSGRMNKDYDDRLVPNGEYRDALNIEVTTSEDSDVGTVQNIKGNALLSYIGGTENATCVGKISNEKDDKLYWLVHDEPLGATIPSTRRTVSRGTGVGEVPIDQPVQSFSTVENPTGENLVFRDFIAEYDYETRTTRPVIVDIYKVDARVSSIPINQNFNSFEVADPTGIQPGMSIIGHGWKDNVTVFNVELTSSGATIFISIDGGLTNGYTQIFSPVASVILEWSFGRVLNFESSRLITGINIIDDMLFWTDNETEPKKVNIKRGKFGSLNFLTHTKLSITEFPTYDLFPSPGTVVGLRNPIQEKHITVIRKSPLRAPSLEMRKSPRLGEVTGKLRNNEAYTPFRMPFSNLALNYVQWVHLDASHIPTAVVSGDKLILKNSPLPGQSSEEIIVKVIDTDFTNTTTDPDYNPTPGMLDPKIKLEILSWSPDISDNHLNWSLELQQPVPLFEFKFPRFACRYKYQDGEYSAFSPFSEVAFLPKEFDYLPKKGYNLGMVNDLRYLAVKDFVLGGELTGNTSDTIIEDALPDDVESINILYKETDSTNVYSVANIKRSDLEWNAYDDTLTQALGDNSFPLINTAEPSIPSLHMKDADVSAKTRGYMRITAEMIQATIPPNQLLRSWDTVPRKALAQEMTGNRLVYGNYLQNYNFNVSFNQEGRVDLKLDTKLIDFGYENPEEYSGLPVDFAYNSNSTTTGLTSYEKMYSYSPAKSIKSMRTYQLGISYLDEYGRETPVFSDSPSGRDASLYLDKNTANKQVKFIAQARNQAPRWAKWFKFFIKETASEYYNLSMDRWYDAKDGNIWLSFPSCERNKVDEETFLILKKAADSDDFVKEDARYKVIAIENEAPDYIKTIWSSFGSVTEASSGGDTFGGASVGGFPIPGAQHLLIKDSEFEGVGWDESILGQRNDKLYLRMTFGSFKSEWYRITSVSKPSSGTFYRFDVNRKFGQDMALTSASNSHSTKNEPLIMEVAQRTVQGRAEFDGRFFVKVLSDNSVNTHLKVLLTFSNFYRVHSAQQVQYINPNTSWASLTSLGPSQWSAFGYASPGKNGPNIDNLSYQEPKDQDPDFPRPEEERFWAWSPVTYEAFDKTHVRVSKIRRNTSNNDASNYWKRVLHDSSGFFIDECQGFSQTFSEDTWATCGDYGRQTWDGQNCGHCVVGGKAPYSSAYSGGGQGSWADPGFPIPDRFVMHSIEGSTSTCPNHDEPQEIHHAYGERYWDGLWSHYQFLATPPVLSGCLNLDPVRGSGCEPTFDEYTYNMSRWSVDGTRTLTAVGSNNILSTEWGLGKMFPTAPPSKGFHDGNYKCDISVTGCAGPHENREISTLHMSPDPIEKVKFWIKLLTKNTLFTWLEDPDKIIYITTHETFDEPIKGKGPGFGTPDWWLSKHKVYHLFNTAYHFTKPQDGITGDPPPTASMGYLLADIPTDSDEDYAYPPTHLDLAGEIASSHGVVWGPLLTWIQTHSTSGGEDPETIIEPERWTKRMRATIKAKAIPEMGGGPMGSGPSKYLPTNDPMFKAYFDANNEKLNLSTSTPLLDTTDPAPGIRSDGMPSGYGSSPNIIPNLKSWDGSGLVESQPPGSITWQLLDPTADEDFDEVETPSSTNPAIWETEPKENVGLDIYHEVGQVYPTKLNKETCELFAPVGSEVQVYRPSTSPHILPGQKVSLPNGPWFVKAWNWYPTFTTSGKDIRPLTPGINAEVYIVDKNGNPAIASGGDANNTNTSPAPHDHLLFLRPDGSETGAKVTEPINYPNTPQTTAYTAGANLKWKQNRDFGVYTVDEDVARMQAIIPWFNGYSFRNGVESNRIRDDYNEVTIDKGPKASITLEIPYKEERRETGLIYSGIYNSMTGINNLNQFIIAEKITKDLNPEYGSIQKLHTRDTDLITLCEDKVLKVLANKDALFNADGSKNITSNFNVLGQTVPFVGEYGISKNPESFASESYRAYFTDKTRKAVLRLSRDGLTNISDYGMKDWFSDNLKGYNRLVGSFNAKKTTYDLTLVNATYGFSPTYNGETISFHEPVNGWNSFKSFLPELGISMNNSYYTFKQGELWEHNVDHSPITGEDIERNSFYYTDPQTGDASGIRNSTSHVTVLLNDMPSIMKSFGTLNYEGSQARILSNLGNDTYYDNVDKPGWYVRSIQTDKQSGRIINFVNKEDKWFGKIQGEATRWENNQTSVGGSGNVDTREFSVQGLGNNASVDTSNHSALNIQAQTPTTSEMQTPGGSGETQGGYE